MDYGRGNGRSRVNGYAAKWCEIAAGHRFTLELADEYHCDGYATADTPGNVAEGTPVEVKSCMVWIGNGHTSGGSKSRMRGRWTFSPTHDQLVAEGGEYALVVYEVVDGYVVVHRLALVPATTIDALLPETETDYPKLGWPHVFGLNN